MSSLARHVWRCQTAFGSHAASSVWPSSACDGLFSLHASFGLTDVARGKMRAVSAQGARARPGRLSGAWTQGPSAASAPHAPAADGCSRLRRAMIAFAECIFLAEFWRASRKCGDTEPLHKTRHFVLRALVLHKTRFFVLTHRIPLPDDNLYTHSAKPLRRDASQVRPATARSAGIRS